MGTGKEPGKGPIYRMERKGGKLYRQLYYYDESINGYRKSKFPKLVSAKIVSDKEKPAKRMPSKQPQQRQPQPKRQMQPVRQSTVQPQQPQQDPRAKFTRVPRSGATMSLMDEYANLGKRW